MEATVDDTHKKKQLASLYHVEEYMLRLSNYKHSFDMEQNVSLANIHDAIFVIVKAQPVIE